MPFESRAKEGVRRRRRRRRREEETEGVLFRKAWMT
jgi:hypothetical protein